MKKKMLHKARTSQHPPLRGGLGGLLLLLFYITSIQIVAGQAKVTVMYDEDEKTIHVTNDGTDAIVFSFETRNINDYMDPNPDLKKLTPANKKLEKCGITLKYLRPPRLLPDSKGKKTYRIEEVEKPKGQFCYYVVNDREIGEKKYVDIQTKKKQSQSPQNPQKPPSEPPQQTTEEKPVQPPPKTPDPVPNKKEDDTSPVNADIKPIHEYLQVPADDPIDIQYKFTGKYKNITWKKKPPQTIKVNTTDSTVTITGKISQTGTYSYSITILGKNGGEDKTLNKELKITKKTAEKPTEKPTAPTEQTTPDANPKEQPQKDKPDVEPQPEVAPESPTETEIKNEEEPPYNLFYVIGGILVLLFLIGITFYIRTFLKNKKIEHLKQTKKNSGQSMLFIENDDTMKQVSYNIGLSDVKEKAGETYYEINMRFIFEDTTIKNVYFNRTAILDIYKFFSDFLKYDAKTNETGCFLTGRWEYAPKTEQQMYNITIESIVEPGDDVIYGEYNLNFGAKIGITLNYALENLCEKTGNEYVHTAWMHSHPGLGLFLSSQDLNVQSQLAHSNHQGRMLAIVIDSNSPDLKTAFFAPKQDGTMNNDNDLKQTLSLETLYQWAKTLPNQEKNTNYYSMNILPQKGKVGRALFTGAAIIGMDMAITPNDMGLRGCFYGTCQGNELLLNDFKETTGMENNPLSCLLIVPHFSYTEILRDYLLHIAHFEMAVIYAFEDGNIYLLTKNEQNKYPEINDRIPSVSLMKMKEWTRRKR